MEFPMAGDMGRRKDDVVLSVSVVEDDDDCRTQMCGFLQRYGRENGERVEVTSYADGEDIAARYKPGCDIILMDIEMRFMNGMDAAAEIRRTDDAVIIIFVTNAPQYAMKGYEVGAFDYILKPMTYGTFRQHFERAVRSLRKKQGSFVTLPMAGGFQRVRTDAIRYVEVRDHTLVLHTTNGDMAARVTMRELEEKLDGSVFFRCNKMFLINLDYVDGLDGSDVIIGDETVIVSRARRKPLLDALNDRMGETTL
ncbi:LytTR family transcriptional regulator [Bifidobacterium eulemuris]|uniref:LytTR family transcriptional regulator n=2 Tax=Bifidobacterium eulemuris TaxID=1765219 RepID=A0A261FYN5_9BIFI|nr:LytTR family transcriptional regulator [Bifidobacterium eulemuris]